MVERRSLSELWLGGEAGSVTQFLSQFSNLLMLANGVHPKLFSRLLPLGVRPWRKTRKLLHELIEKLARNRGFEPKVNSCKLLQDLPMSE